MTNKMKDPNKDFVLFQDEVTPNLKLMRNWAVKESDFEGYTYSHNRNEDTEVWVKQ